MKTDQSHTETKKKWITAWADLFDMGAVAMTLWIAPKIYALTKPFTTVQFAELYRAEYFSLVMLLWGAICAGLVLFSLRVMMLAIWMAVGDKSLNWIKTVARQVKAD